MIGRGVLYPVAVAPAGGGGAGGGVPRLRLLFLCPEVRRWELGELGQEEEEEEEEEELRAKGAVASVS